MSAPINLNQAIFALSDALDLVGIDEVRHGKRVGCMAFGCAKAMGLEKAECERCSTSACSMTAGCLPAGCTPT